jgi:hypothetical protein
VREERLELSRVAPLEPKSSAYTNFATLALHINNIWGGRWGSNPRPPESQSGALPTELRPPYVIYYMARLAGFEPATLGLEGRCSIQMSYRRPKKARRISVKHNSLYHAKLGRGGGIRTPDILLPKQARYQTALHPDLTETRIILGHSPSVNPNFIANIHTAFMLRYDNSSIVILRNMHAKAS